MSSLLLPFFYWSMNTNSWLSSAPAIEFLVYRRLQKLIDQNRIIEDAKKIMQIWCYLKLSSSSMKYSCREIVSELQLYFNDKDTVKHTLLISTDKWRKTFDFIVFTMYWKKQRIETAFFKHFIFFMLVTSSTIKKVANYYIKLSFATKVCVVLSDGFVLGVKVRPVAKHEPTTDFFLSQADLDALF